MAVLQGIGISRGIAIAPAFVYRPAALQFSRRRAEGVLAEMERFEQAMERAWARVQALRSAVPQVIRPEVDRLLEVQALLLADPALVDRTRGAILEGVPAEQAWQEAVEAYLSIFARIRDESLRARAVELSDIGRQVLAELLPQPDVPPLAGAGGTIVVAEMLGSTEALQLACRLPLGLALAGGTLSSPVAVVAQRLELPAVVALGEDLWQQVRGGEILALDGSTGVVEVAPSSEVLSYYRERQRLLKAVHPDVEVGAPAHTADGWRVDVRVDLEQPANLMQALARGAEGVGLARTDYLFLGRAAPPGEEEQMAAYHALLEQAGVGRVTFCSLAVGLEEELPFAAEPDTRNPLLGLRGLRLSLAYLSAFREQLRAILRAGAGRPIGVAFPMADTISEVRAALEWLRRAQQDLQNAGVEHSREVTTALLLQTPVALLNLEPLAAEVGALFLDLDRLTEYLLGCDRHNLRVAHLFRPLHPVVLRLVRDAVAVAHRQGKRLDVCGDAAGTPAAVAVLLGLGVDGFCLPPDRIAAAKSLLRQLKVPEVQSLAERVVGMVSAAEVEAEVEQWLARRMPKL